MVSFFIALPRAASWASSTMSMDCPSGRGAEAGDRGLQQVDVGRGQPQRDREIPDRLVTQAGVDGDVLGDPGDEAGERGRVGDDLRAQTLGHDRLDDHPLVLGPVQVTVRQALALADEPERLLAGDGDLALGVVEPVRGEGVLVVHRDPAQGLRQLDEALEVDHHHVVHPGAQQALQGLHHQLRAAVRERGVDLALAVPGDVDPHVPREGGDVRLVVRLVQVHHHDRVAATGTGVAGIPGVRAEQDEVHRARWPPGPRWVGPTGRRRSVSRPAGCPAA